MLRCNSVVGAPLLREYSDDILMKNSNTMKFYLMKSTIVLLLTAGVMSMSGYAQTFLGLKGGITASRVTYQFDAGEPYLDYQTRLAPHIGLMAEFRLSDRLYFQPELL